MMRLTAILITLAVLGAGCDKEATPKPPAASQSSHAAKSDPPKKVIPVVQLPIGAGGKPIGFTETAMNSAGYIHTGLIEHIIDDGTAVVSIALHNKDGSLLPGVNRTLIIKGVSTVGQADNNGFRLQRCFEIRSTRKYGGTTYFVAEPISEPE
jgi:hypothetical protein